MIDRLLSMFGLARLTFLEDDGPVQRLQVEEGSVGDGERVLDQVPFVGQFGFVSRPPLKSEVLLARFGGRRAASVAIGTNHQPSRLRGLAEGDAALHDARSAFMWLTPGGLVIDGAGLPATIRNVGTLTIEGDIRCTGDVVTRSAAAAMSVNGLHDAYHQHTHGLVKAGTDTSGGPNPAD